MSPRLSARPYALALLAACASLFLPAVPPAAASFMPVFGDELAFTSDGDHALSSFMPVFADELIGCCVDDELWLAPPGSPLDGEQRPLAAWLAGLEAGDVSAVCLHDCAASADVQSELAALGYVNCATGEPPCGCTQTLRFTP